MFEWFKSIWRRALPPPGNSEIAEAYVRAGLDFGDAASQVHTMGECKGFDKLLDAYEKAELAYAQLGYRTLSVDDFISAGGWGRPLEGLLERRRSSEGAVLHAVYYRETYFGKVQGFIQANWAQLMQGKMAQGQVAVPTSKHLKAPTS